MTFDLRLNSLFNRSMMFVVRREIISHPEHVNDAEYSEIMEIPSETYYGKGYQDIYSRKPNIEKAKRLLQWEPEIELEDALVRTLHSFLEENTADGSR